jgi:hypothetical protein
VTARPRPLLSLPSLLRLLVALIVSIAGLASGAGIAAAQNGVAAINIESGPVVGAEAGIPAGHVGSDTRLFDDGVSGCCVAPRTAPGLADDFADHVVLGKSKGLPANAEKLGGRHLMGSADWQADVLSAISNPNTRISVALDGLEGAGTAHSRVMAAVQRASSGRGSPLDWELMQLHQSGRWSTTGFYEGGNAITNPFG